MSDSNGTDSLNSYSKGYGTDGPGRLGKYYMRLAVGEYKRPSPFDTASMTPEKYVYLPLPMEMRDDTLASYGNTDMGLIGNLMDNGVTDPSSYGAEVMRQSGNLAKTLTNWAKPSSSFLKAAPKIGGILSGVTQSIDNVFSADQVTSAVSQIAGASPNPNPSVIFQGPRLRELFLNWMLMPTNEQDSQNIRKVLNYLKKSALPENTVKGSAAILEYPRLVQVNFYPWDTGGSGKYGWTENSIIRMKRCFMGSVNVNYTAGNVPAFFEGGTNEPVMISLSISLIEAEYFLAGDYDSAASGKYDGLLDFISGTLTGNDLTKDVFSDDSVNETDGAVE